MRAFAPTTVRWAVRGHSGGGCCCCGTGHYGRGQPATTYSTSTVYGIILLVVLQSYYTVAAAQPNKQAMIAMRAATMILY